MSERWHAEVLLKGQPQKHHEALPNAVIEKQPLRMVSQYVQPPIGRAPGVNLKPMSEEHQYTDLSVCLLGPLVHFVNQRFKQSFCISMF